MGLARRCACWLAGFLLLPFTAVAESPDGPPSEPEPSHLTIVSIDYHTGLLDVSGLSESWMPGQVLSASSAWGSLELRILRREGTRGQAVARDPDLLALYQPGQVLDVTLQPRAEFASDVSEILREMESFEADVGALIDGASPESRLAGGAELRGRWNRWRGDIGVRIGYDRFARSGVVITDLDPNDRESVERGLAELEALIERAREVPGIDQSDLDRAEELAAITRAILDDPDGDLEAAVANIIAGQIIVEAAVERAGQDPNAIRVEEYDDEVEETLDEYAFVNLRRDFRWGNGGDLYLDEHLEGGSRFLDQRIRLDAQHPLTSSTRVEVESDSDLRLYRQDFADNVFTQGLDLETVTEVSRDLSVSLGGHYLFRREFDTSSDDGFQAGGPRAEAAYRLGRWGRIEAGLAGERRRYNEAPNDVLDRRQLVTHLAYDYFGGRSLAGLAWDRIDRDADLPADEDDYTEHRVTGMYSYSWNRQLTTGIEARVENREYVTTGPYNPSIGARREEDNTDYVLWGMRPFVELRWSRVIWTTFDYEYTRVENEDEVDEDGIDKSLGDYDSHEFGLSVQWTPHERWELFLRQEYETRNYLNGETGKLETWFADFRNLADFDAYTASALLVYHLTPRWDLELDGLYRTEIYPTYDELDSDQTTVQLAIRYFF